ncbi:MAG: YjbQ family protein [bacterium]|nr:YjbQ family protein [bacterium]
MALSQNLHTLEVRTTGKGLFEINQQLQGWLDLVNAMDGLLTLFIKHTSASLTVQENADPAVALDLVDALEGLVPERSDYRHCSEGPDDMPSHIKSMVTQTQLAIPVQGGQMVLGMWQGVFVIEHRVRPHTRKIALHYLGDSIN